ncbi:MAG TPA: hypothetical protein VM575_18610 [Nocardioides sp.]|nr:hypothetical protein [Nocardioides sp.]
MNRTLAATTAGLLAGVLLAPALVASLIFGEIDGVGALRAGLPDAFTAHWSAGDATVAGDLARAVGYWTTFHAVKAVLATLLLVTVARALQRVRRGPARVALQVLAVLAAVVAVVNVQGAIAPLSSLLSMLPGEAADAALTADDTPAFAALVHDFAVYHAAAVVLVGVAAAGVAVIGRRAWLHGRRGPALVAAAGVGLLGVVVLANVTTAADPEPALRAFLASAQR